jgi:hypothetical protein
MAAFDYMLLCEKNVKIQAGGSGIIESLFKFVPLYVYIQMLLNVNGCI